MEPTPQCHFVFYAGPRAGQAEAFTSARITIGRGASCDFRLDPGYEDVASQHAEIILEEGSSWMLYDLSNRGGTFINGQKIKERQTLLPEDYVRFGKGGPEVIFRIGPPVPGYQPIPALTAEDAQLQFFSGSEGGKTFTVSGSGVTRIGRRTELEVPLDPRGDMIVSGNHCSIAFEDGAFLLTDTSRNGTYVNGILVEGHTELSDGDVIMLGDGGPQARFRAKSTGVIYPNLRAYYPTAGSSVTPQQPQVSQQDFLSAGPAPGTSAMSGSAAAAPARLPFADEDRPRRWPLVLVALAVLVGMGFALRHYSRSSGAKKPVTTTAAKLPDYLGAVRSGSEKTNQVGNYTIALPEGWALRQQDALYSIESPDKEIAVDYMRGLSVTDANVAKILKQDSLELARIPIAAKSGDRELSAYLAKGGGVARLAVIHRPKNEVPVMALLETQSSLVSKMPRDLLDALLISNVKTAKLALPATPTPVPTRTPTPAVAQPAKPSPTVIARVTPAPHATPTATTAAASPAPTQIASVTPPTTTRVTTPAPSTPASVTPAPTATTENVTPTPTANVAQTMGPQRGSVSSQKLALSIDLPENWTGTSNEDDGIIQLESPENLQVRVARDPKSLDLDTVLSSMTSDGWKRVGARKQQSFSMAELKKPGEDLILVLIPEPASGSTLVVYASQEKDISEAQRNAIVQVVQQLRPGRPGVTRK